jgi:molybdopterin converting factor subunit 1
MMLFMKGMKVSQKNPEPATQVRSSFKLIPGLLRVNCSPISSLSAKLSRPDDPMKVLFFAQSRQLAGCDHHDLEVDKPVTQREFWARLVEAFPALAPQQKTARLARRETYLDSGELLQPGDEIAVIPPVSGG